jgi:hypothetical protein
MDLNGYIDWIERHVEDPDTLATIRERAAIDNELADADRGFVSERIGMYLADLERAGELGLEDEDEGEDGTRAGA